MQLIDSAQQRRDASADRLGDGVLVEQWQFVDGAVGTQEHDAVGIDLESGIGLRHIVGHDEIEALAFEFAAGVGDEIVVG